MNNVIPAALPPGLSTIAADDGCPLVLRKLNDASAGIPLLFVHALAMDGSMWGAVAHRLAPSAPMIAMDCRGHGLSGKPQGPYTTERFARDIDNVLDAIQAPKAVVIGCSMGGTVAQAFAGLYPQRLAALCAIDTTAWYGDGAPAAWEGRAQKARGEGLAALIPFQSERWFSPGFVARAPEVLQYAIDVFLRNDVDAYAAACLMLGHADERARLDSYRGPASVVVGADDYATPVAMARDIADRIAGAALTVIPQVRHYTPLESPAAIAAAVRSLLKQIPEFTG